MLHISTESPSYEEQHDVKRMLTAPSIVKLWPLTVAVGMGKEGCEKWKLKYIANVNDLYGNKKNHISETLRVYF